MSVVLSDWGLSCFPTREGDGMDGREGGREERLPRDRTRWMEVAWIFPETWNVWSIRFAGCLAADSPLYHGIHDSIGNMSWSPYLLGFCI